MSQTNPSLSWKRCGVCKRDLGFGVEFYECSVSTCTTGRNHPVFCSVSCWDQHVPVMRHRDAWAEQKRSPSREDWERESTAPEDSPPAGGSHASPPRRIVVASTSTSTAAPASAISDDILVVASKLKSYIRARSGMNTSESVLDELSDIVRGHADRAIENARLDGRRTVMNRDFKPRAGGG